jgi:hypothetical protein
MKETKPGLLLFTHILSEEATSVENVDWAIAGRSSHRRNIDWISDWLCRRAVHRELLPRKEGDGETTAETASSLIAWKNGPFHCGDGRRIVTSQSPLLTVGIQY